MHDILIALLAISPLPFSGNVVDTKPAVSLLSRPSHRGNSPQSALGNMAENSIKSLPAAQQIELAFDAIFGEDPNHEIISAGRQVRFSGGELIWLGDTAILLTPGADQSPSQHARGTLGIFYLVPDGYKLRAVHEAPFAIEGGSREPPEWSVSYGFLDDIPVIVSTSRSFEDGYECATSAITGLFAEAPGEYISFPSAFDNSANPPVRDRIVSIEGSITNIVKNQSFTVTYRGSRNFTHTYKRYFDSYARSETNESEDMPRC